MLQRIIILLKLLILLLMQTISCLNLLKIQSLERWEKQYFFAINLNSSSSSIVNNIVEDTTLSWHCTIHDYMYNGLISLSKFWGVLTHIQYWQNILKINVFWIHITIKFCKFKNWILGEKSFTYYVIKNEYTYGKLKYDGSMIDCTEYWQKELHILFCSITPTNLRQFSKGSFKFKNHEIKNIIVCLLF